MKIKELLDNIDKYLLTEEALDASTPFLQFCLRMFLTLFVIIYIQMLEIPSLFFPMPLVYMGMAGFVGCQVYLRWQSVLNGRKAEYVVFALVLDVFAAHLIWLCDPNPASPTFIFVIISTFGNSLQNGKLSFKYICLLSFILTVIVFVIRVKTLGWFSYNLCYFLTGAAMVIHAYILLINSSENREKIKQRNLRLAKVNEDLVTEVNHRKKAEETLRDNEIELKQYQDSLEQMVEQRTQAYEQANRLLKMEIDARVIIEKELIESKNRYQDLFENVSDYLIIHDFDGHVIDSNLNFKKELRGMNIDPEAINAKELFLSHYSPEQLDTYLSAVRENGHDTGLFSIISENGEKVIMEYKSSIVYDAQGNPYGVQGVGIDITARWTATKELKDMRKQLENIIEFLPDATLVINRNKKVIAWNLAMVELTGISKKDMLGRSDHEYSLPLYGKREKILADFICNDEPVPDDAYDFVQKKKHTCYAEAFMPALGGGEGAYIWTTASPLFDEHENLSGAIQSFRDITDRKKAEEEAQSYQEQLFQAAKMTSLGTLVAGIAHEINNPVSTIIMNAPMLKRITDSLEPLLDAHMEHIGGFELGGMNYNAVKERVPVLIENISNGARRIKSIVKELKEYSRETKTEMTDTVDINSVVTKASELVSSLIKKTTGVFEVSFNDAIPLLKGNSLRLEQVLINLLINACQSLPDINCGIYVKTDYDPEKGVIIVAVKDEGAGMAPDIIARIKDPFYTTKRDHGGTGLGLSISDRIIREHNGRLAYSSRVGKGTTALLTLPCKTKD